MIDIRTENLVNEFTAISSSLLIDEYIINNKALNADERFEGVAHTLEHISKTNGIVKKYVEIETDKDKIFYYAQIQSKLGEMVREIKSPSLVIDGCENEFYLADKYQNIKNARDLSKDMLNELFINVSSKKNDEKVEIKSSNILIETKESKEFEEMFVDNPHYIIKEKNNIDIYEEFIPQIISKNASDSLEIVVEDYLAYNQIDIETEQFIKSLSKQFSDKINIEKTPAKKGNIYINYLISSDNYNLEFIPEVNSKLYQVKIENMESKNFDIADFKSSQSNNDWIIDYTADTYNDVLDRKTGLAMFVNNAQVSSQQTQFPTLSDFEYIEQFKSADNLSRLLELNFHNRYQDKTLSVKNKLIESWGVLNLLRENNIMIDYREYTDMSKYMNNLIHVNETGNIDLTENGKEIIESLKNEDFSDIDLNTKNKDLLFLCRIRDIKDQLQEIRKPENEDISKIINECNKSIRQYSESNYTSELSVKEGLDICKKIKTDVDSLFNQAQDIYRGDSSHLDLLLHRKINEVRIESNSLTESIHSQIKDKENYTVDKKLNFMLKVS